MEQTGTSVKIECPGCGAALTYDPVSGKMTCAHCGGSYDPAELHYEKDSSPDGERIPCKVYVCGSCGAELNISDTECSTFCAYCGQPTVVFDRVATMRKPEYIIPFSVTRERAVELMREKLKAGKFVPKKLKNVEMERVSGIYIPFWLFDVVYSDEQYLKATKGSGEDSKTFYYYMAAERRFSRLTLDGAVRLNDRLSRRLEPYDLSGMREFDMDYLSGFYSDRYDADAAELETDAIARAKQYFDAEICDRVCGEDDVHDAAVELSSPRAAVTGKSYALFPAWFLTFRYKNLPYTILVNGQNEKVVGGLPSDKGKFIRDFLVNSIFTIPLTILFYLVIMVLVCLEEGEAVTDAGIGLGGLISLAIMGFFALGGFLHNLRTLRQSRKYTTADAIRAYSTDREKQKGGGA